MRIVGFLQEYYTMFFVWLSCLAAVFVYRRVQAPSFKRFALLIIFLGILETIGNALGFFWGIRDHFFFNFVFAIELIALPFFYRSWLQSAGLKKVISVYLIIFPVFALINWFFIQRFYTLHTYDFVFGGSFVLLLSIAYLLELYANEGAKNILRDPVFWFSVAYFTFFSVSVPYYGMMNYLLTNQREFADLYYRVMMDGAICLTNVLLTIGFLCILKPAREPES